MRRFALLILMIALATAVEGQVIRYGARGTVGLSYIDDDLFFNSPVFSTGVEAYADFAFLGKRTFWRDILTIQTGLGIDRRGGTFEMDFPHIQARRSGIYHSLYMTLPLLVSLRGELPVRTRHPHYFRLTAGPTASFALGGLLHDRHYCLTSSSATVNFDSLFTGVSGLYNHISRFDAGARLALGYEHRQYTVDVVMDFGFIKLRPVDELLINLNVEPGEVDDNANNEGGTYLLNATGRNGRLRTVSLRLGYQFKIKKKIRPAFRNVFM